MHKTIINKDVNNNKIYIIMYFFLLKQLAPMALFVVSNKMLMPVAIKINARITTGMVLWKTFNIQTFIFNCAQVHRHQIQIIMFLVIYFKSMVTILVSMVNIKNEKKNNKLWPKLWSSSLKGHSHDFNQNLFFRFYVLHFECWKKNPSGLDLKWM